MAYNGFQQLTTQYQEHTGAVNTSTSPRVQYDYADGSQNTIRLSSMTYPNGRVLSSLYSAGSDDALSRPSELNDGMPLVRYTYLGLGSFVKADYPQPAVGWDLTSSTCGGASSSSSAKGSSSSSSVSGTSKYPGLDQFGRVVNNLWCKYTGATGAVDQIRYGYDRASNRLWRKNVVAATGFDELYRYDGAQRLEDFNRGTLNAQANNISSLTLKQQWELDATGNWSRFEQADQADATQNLDQERTHNQFNEITGISATVGPVWVTPQYDRNGNMTVMPNGDAPTQSFQNTWDAWNRLVTVMDGATTVATMQYDGQNWRTKKVAGGTTRHYYYSNQWQVLEERLNTSTDPERQFVWGLRYIDDLVERDRAPSGSGALTERLYSMQDANWNITSICNTSGAVQERYSYTAYGVPLILNADFNPISESTFDWETLYCGYLFDSATGSYQVRYRDLLPILGRWLSIDPIGFASGDFNPFGYVHANPLKAVDPLGLQSSIPYPEALPVGVTLAEALALIAQAWLAIPWWVKAAGWSAVVAWAIWRIGWCASQLAQCKSRMLALKDPERSTLNDACVRPDRFNCATVICPNVGMVARPNVAALKACHIAFNQANCLRLFGWCLLTGEYIQPSRFLCGPCANFATCKCAPPPVACGSRSNEVLNV